MDLGCWILGAGRWRCTNEQNVEPLPLIDKKQQYSRMGRSKATPRRLFEQFSVVGAAAISASASLTEFQTPGDVAKKTADGPPKYSSPNQRKTVSFAAAVVTPTKSESSRHTKRKRGKKKISGGEESDDDDDDLLFDDAKAPPAAASRRILDEDELKTSQVAVKKRRTIFDNDDEEDTEVQATKEDGQPQNLFSIDCREGVTVIRVPPSVIISPTQTSSRMQHELIQFHLPNATISSTAVDDFSLGSIEAVDLLLRHCNNKNNETNNLLLEIDPILKAFETGIIDASLKTNKTPCGCEDDQHKSEVRNGVIVSISLLLDCVVDKQLSGSMTLPPIPTPRKLPGNNVAFSKPHLSYTLIQLLGSIFKGSIFEDVSDHHPSQQTSTNNNESSSVITAKMVYSVVDNVHVKEFEDRRGRGRNTGESSVSLNVPGLVPTLRPYQEAAVRWMLKREGKLCNNDSSSNNEGATTLDTTDEDVNVEWELCWYVVIQSPMDISSNASNNDVGDVVTLTGSNIILSLPKWKKGKSSPDECQFFCNPFSGGIAKSYADAKLMMLGRNHDNSFRGGILAESMGLGKSVEVLACILANPSASALTDRNEVEADDIFSSSHDTIGVIGHQSASARRTEKPPSLHNEICICGRSSLYTGCLSWVVCEACAGVMHGRCAGFESDEDLLAKTKEGQSGTGVRESQKEHCPSCVAASIAENPSTAIIESRATLIVTPPAILTQWQREVSRHTKDVTTGKPLKVAVYSGVKDLCSAGSSSPHDDFRLVHPKHLADADIVLVTFQSLMSDLGHSDDNPFAGFGAKGGSRLRSRKRYKVVPSPLTSIKWWRVALDEAQRVETPTAASARMAQKLLTDKRWCVSGTPIGRGKLEDLYGLTVFLSMKPFDEKRWFSNCFRLSHGDSLKRLSHLLQNLMWRSTKANRSVREQMGIPEQEEKKIMLQFSSVERYFYDRQKEETSTAVAMWTSAKGSNSLSYSLQKLRAACCHPQIGSSGVGERVRKQRHISNVLTMDQILQKLIDDAKLKCEEAQRIVILHSNALACLTKLKAESDEDSISKPLLEKSIKVYEGALDLADTNAIPSEIDASASLSGSMGFCSTQRTIDHGPAILRWQIKMCGEQSIEKEVWSNISFNGPAKAINCIRVRICPTLPSELQGEAASSWSILRPKECVLQMSSAAIGGAFVDVCTFSLADNATFDWQEIQGFHAKKSKCWRLLVRSFHNAARLHVEPCQYYVGLDVHSFEPEVTFDNLQRLHILHNASLVLSTLLQVNDSSDSSERREKLDIMDRESQQLHDSYMGLATSAHNNSKIQFDQASQAREKCDEKLSSLSKDFDRPWYEDVLAWCAVNDGEVDHYDLVELVARDLTGYYESIHTQPNHVLIRRGKFPSFTTVHGLYVALETRIEQGKEQLGLLRGMDITKCLKKVRCLRSNPDDGEVYENSHCRQCRKDWQQTGPVCCKFLCTLFDGNVVLTSLTSSSTSSSQPIATWNLNCSNTNVCLMIRRSMLFYGR